MQNILNKLAKIEKAQPKRSKFTKAKPNRVAVKLSVIDDIEQNLSRFDDAESDASWLAYEWGDQLIEKIDEYRMEIGQIDDFIVNGNIRDLEEVTEILENALMTLEEKANELGIDPNDLYSDFDDLVDRVARAKVDLEPDAYKKYVEIIDYAGFLGNFWK
jgi:hypothetical protein